MALFGRKKGGDDKDPGEPGNGKNGDGGNGSPESQPVYSAGNAQKWFDRAKVAYETTNYEYAMNCWLSGLKQDPTSMRGLESFVQSATAFINSSGGKPPSKETMNAFGGRSELDRYVAALLASGIKPLDALLAVRATEAAAKLGLPEPTHWLGERAMLVVANEKKPRKDLFVKLVEAFSKVQAFDRAVKAGELAVKLDPLDGKLAAEVRNLAAQATMSQGGYETTGQAGGFRANIRDAEKQRQLEEQERIVKTEETVDRLVRESEEDYLKRSDDPHATTLYVKRLMERGRPEDLKRARQVLKKAYETLKQFRFREMDGDIKLRLARAEVGKYRQAAEKEPANAQAQKNYQAAQQQFLKMEIEEYRLRVENYPTDLPLKFELGKRLFELGDLDNAIPLFQESQNDAKRRVDSQNMLAQAFQRIEYVDEAINTYRNALEAHKVPGDEMGMTLRYGLMTALQIKAEKERELSAAEEADKLASAIAIQQFNYRDIRQRRDALKKLIGDIKRGGPEQAA